MVFTSHDVVFKNHAEVYTNCVVIYRFPADKYKKIRRDLQLYPGGS